MDADGFTLQGRGRRNTTRGSALDRGRDAFQREVPRYAGTSHDFDSAHTRRYGREEGLGRDGHHHHGASSRFPHGSEREKLHTQYAKSTKPRDNARDAYQHGLADANDEFDNMSYDEQKYYKKHTGGLPPHQHERLDPRATTYRDKCFENATGRETFLRGHPHGYHTAESQQVHHDYAGRAYGEFEYARDQQKHHARYRSYSNIDPRRDQWGRPMSHR